MKQIMKIVLNDIGTKINMMKFNHNMSMAKKHVYDCTDIDFKKYTGRALKNIKLADALSKESLNLMSGMPQEKLAVLFAVEDAPKFIFGATVVLCIASKIMNTRGGYDHG